jgi:transposase InsO family protein
MPSDATTRIKVLVRELRGLAGAASLSRSVEGVSRRQAASLKQEELRAMERERKANASRVEIMAPGIVRGFDSMHVPTTQGVRHVVAVADGATPYRTSIAVVPCVDARHLRELLERDFAKHGAPLVVRADRARAHRSADVDDALREHGVLLLHGPPHYPCYYGQLERQNLEHRTWFEMHGSYSPEELESDCLRMLFALNCLWRRPTLGWRTAECAWGERVTPIIDRDELRDIVTDGAQRRIRAGVDPDLASRLAIETALTDRGLLKIKNSLEPTVLCDLLTSQTLKQLARHTRHSTARMKPNKFRTPLLMLKVVRHVCADEQSK